VVGMEVLDDEGGAEGTGWIEGSVMFRFWVM
jgi:hypothetical protein